MKYRFSAVVLLLTLLGSGCVSTANISSGSEQKHAVLPVSGTKLDLSNQGLTQVPQDIFKQTDLVELNLSGNHLTNAIPAEIRLLTKLEVLDLSDNALTGLPAEIGQLRHLKTLDLSNNQLTGLPLELGQLHTLETLDLRGNQYAKQDLDQIRANLTQTAILVD